MTGSGAAWVWVMLAFDLTCVNLVMFFSASFVRFLLRTSLNFFDPHYVVLYKVSQADALCILSVEFFVAIFHPIFKLLNIPGVTADSNFTDKVFRFCSSPFSVIDCHVMMLFSLYYQLLPLDLL